MKPILTLISFLFLSFIGNTQFQAPQQTDSVDIYVLTCSPGVDLYSVFGHTAILVKTPKTDNVYNYGSFNFNTDNFYVKFARGQLPYRLAREKYGYFQYGYIYEKRQIWAQKINLNPSQENRLLDLLEENMLPENREYKYDFFYDNCATRVLDIIDASTGNQIQWNTPEEGNGFTFRNMIDVYLENMEWSDLGIDIALGLPCDNKLEKNQQAFLPDSLMDMFKKAELDGKPLVSSAFEALPAEEINLRKPFLERTFPVILSVCLVLFGVLFLFRRKRAGRALAGFILFLNGLVGLLVFLLWFFTDHNATINNLNILWASPLNLILPFISITRNRWLKLFAVIAMFTLIIWYFLPQDLHESLIPFIILSIYSALVFLRSNDE